MHGDHSVQSLATAQFTAAGRCDGDTVSDVVGIDVADWLGVTGSSIASSGLALPEAEAVARDDSLGLPSGDADGELLGGMDTAITLPDGDTD